MRQSRRRCNASVEQTLTRASPVAAFGPWPWGIAVHMTQVITAVVMFGLFLALYEFLRRRAARDGGSKPPVQWRWLAAITGAAALALIVGLLTR